MLNTMTRDKRISARGCTGAGAWVLALLTGLLLGLGCEKEKEKKNELLKIPASWNCGWLSREECLKKYKKERALADRYAAVPMEEAGDKETFSSPRLQFVYKAPGQKHHTLWSCRLDGSDLRRVTTEKMQQNLTINDGVRPIPVRSPNNRYLALRLGEDVSLIDLKEKRVIKVAYVFGRTQFIWSHDSKKLLFRGMNQFKHWDEYNIETREITQRDMFVASKTFSYGPDDKLMATRRTGFAIYTWEGKWLRWEDLSDSIRECRVLSTDGRHYAYLEGGRGAFTKRRIRVVATDRPNEVLYELKEWSGNSMVLRMKPPVLHLLGQGPGHEKYSLWRIDLGSMKAKSVFQTPDEELPDLYDLTLYNDPLRTQGPVVEEPQPIRFPKEDLSNNESYDSGRVQFRWSHPAGGCSLYSAKEDGSDIRKVWNLGCTGYGHLKRSPNKRYVAFQSKKGEYPNSVVEAFVYDLKTGQTKKFAERFSSGRNKADFQWSLDSKKLVAIMRVDKESEKRVLFAFFEYELRSGRLKRHRTLGEFQQAMALHRYGRTSKLILVQDKGYQVLNSQGKVLRTVHFTENIEDDCHAVSPDGKLFAYGHYDSGRRSIRIVETAKPKKVLLEKTYSDSQFFSASGNQCDFSQDGKNLFLPPINYNFYRLDIERKEFIEVLDLPGAGTYSFSGYNRETDRK